MNRVHSADAVGSIPSAPVVQPVVPGPTPGPWTARKAHSGIWDVFAGDCNVVTVYGSGIYPPANEANARLIAAAPDLLAALEGLTEIIAKAGLRQLAQGVELGQISWAMKATDRMEAARAAILKATAANSVGTERSEVHHETGVKP